MKVGRKLVTGALCALVLVFAFSPVSAQNLVVNGDFEGGWGSAAPINGCVAESWTAWGSQITLWEMPGNNCTPDPGNNYQRLIGGNINGTRPNGGIVQAINTTPGQAYDLDLDAAFYTIFHPDNRIRSFTYAHYGYDLTGQTADGNAASIIWVPVQRKDSWSSYHTRFTATNAQTSIWVRANYDGDQLTVLFDVDNISVTPATELLIDILGGEFTDELVQFEQINDTTFRIFWQTDVASTSTVEYDTVAAGKYPDPLEGVIDYASSTTSTELVTNHSLIISGLNIDTLYHFRVSSDAPGYKTVFSRERSFRTPYPAYPEFRNGSFEDGDGNQADFWTLYGYTDGRVGPIPPNSYFGFVPSDGQFLVGAVGSFVRRSGGVYQRIQAQPGKVYTATADYKQFTTPPPGPDDDQWPIEFWLGIDPYGGVDPNSDRIIWSIYDNRTPPTGPYSQAEVQAQAESDAVTIFTFFNQKWGLQFNMSVVDNIQVDLPEYEATSIGDARSQPSGTNITFAPGTEMIVTLVPVVDFGFFYMQDADGTGGIRVNYSGTPPAVGARVNVTGKLDVMPSGERVLTNTTVTIAGTGTTPVRHIVNKTIGGTGYAGATAGLTNEGLLVKVWGEVKSVDFFEGTFMIDDGSGVDGGADGTGIKVTHTNMFPMEGQYVAVIGVVTSEISDGKKIRVIRSREATEPGDFEVIN